MPTYKNFGIVDVRGDWAKFVRMANIAPQLLLKSFPPTARAAMVPFTRKVKDLARSTWPEKIFFTRKSKPAFLWGVKTRVPNKKWHPLGHWRMQFRPSSPGAAVLMEFGSYKNPRRYPKNKKYLAFKNEDGKWIYPKSVASTEPKPVWRRAYASFKASGGPRNIQELLLKNAQATMYNVLIKGGSIPKSFSKIQ